MVDTKTDAGVSRYSTDTHTQWSFVSGAVDGVQAVPLVQLDYGTDLDAAGRAKHHTSLSITPQVLGSDSAQDAVSSLGLEVSYDDGSTWHREELKAKKGTWQASLSAPNGAGYVSIRVTAKQHGGGGVTQTVTGAFGLK